MRELRIEDWPGFKITHDGTLAFKKFYDDVVYIREVNPRALEPYYGAADPVGILYRWGDSDKYIAVFAGINPLECNASFDSKAMTTFKNYLADDPDRYFDLAPVRNITTDDSLYKLATPFNRNNGGYMPVIWNIHSIDSMVSLDDTLKGITNVLQLEEMYPPVDLNDELSQRYMTLQLRFGKLAARFGYNRNHIAYNGRQEDSVLSWPIHYYLSDTEENSAALDTALDNMSELTHKPKFNGKANGLLDAAGLSGKA